MSVKQYKLDIVGIMNDVLGHTHALKSKKAEGLFGSDARQAIDKLDKDFAAAVTAAPAEFKTELNKLKTAAEAAERKLIGASVDKDGIRVAKENGMDAFVTAKKEYQTAKENLRSLFIGKSDVVKSDNVTKAFESLESKLKQAHSLFRGPFGMAKTEGLWETLSHNFEQMQFWDESIRIPAGGKDRSGPMAIRALTVAASVAGMADAVGRSRNAEGDERNGALRIIEFLTSGGVGLAAMAVSKAR